MTAHQLTYKSLGFSPRERHEAELIERDWTHAMGTEFPGWDWSDLLGVAAWAELAVSIVFTPFEIYRQAIKVLAGHREQPPGMNTNEVPRIMLPGDLVTLLQMSAIVNRKKKTLERMYQDGALPAPTIAGGNGKPHEWLWTVVKPILEKRFNLTLPPTFPTDRFIRSR